MLAFTSPQADRDPRWESHPRNRDGVPVSGARFQFDRLNSALNASCVGIVDNQPHTVCAWVFNPTIDGEEAILAWVHGASEDELLRRDNEIQGDLFEHPDKFARMDAFLAKRKRPKSS